MIKILEVEVWDFDTKTYKRKKLIKKINVKDGVDSLNYILEDLMVELGAKAKYQRLTFEKTKEGVRTKTTDYTFDIILRKVEK